jgi:hypothetical protein
MTIFLVRDILCSDYTLGFLILKTEKEVLKLCTCENQVRGFGDPATVSSWKMAGASAIPYGEYKLIYTWSPKYKKDMWRLMGVPGFEGILIHTGNSAKDTAGCVLVGKTRNPKKGTIAYSSDALKELSAFLQATEEHKIVITKPDEYLRYGLPHFH